MKEAKPSTFPLRMPSNLKKALKEKANKEGLSLNAAIIQRLVRSVQRDEIDEGNAAV